MTTLATTRWQVLVNGEWIEAVRVEPVINRGKVNRWHYTLANGECGSVDRKEDFYSPEIELTLELAAARDKLALLLLDFDDMQRRIHKFKLSDDPHSRQRREGLFSSWTEIGYLIDDARSKVRELEKQPQKEQVNVK